MQDMEAFKFLMAARTQIEASDFSHGCMITLATRLAGVGRGSRLWMSERRVQSNITLSQLELARRGLGFEVL